MATRCSDPGRNQWFLGPAGGHRLCPHGGRVSVTALVGDQVFVSPRAWG